MRQRRCDNGESALEDLIVILIIEDDQLVQSLVEMALPRAVSKRQ